MGGTDMPSRLTSEAESEGPPPPAAHASGDRASSRALSPWDRIRYTLRMPTARAAAAATLAAVAGGRTLESATADAEAGRAEQQPGLTAATAASPACWCAPRCGAKARSTQSSALFWPGRCRPGMRSNGRCCGWVLRQLLFFDVPAYAAVAATVDAAGGSVLRGLLNAVLRRVAREGPALASAVDPARANTPAWLWRQWSGAYGGDAGAAAIARAHLHEPPLDLTVAGDPEPWAARLGGRVLPTGTVRLTEAGAVAQLPGYKAGAWWVQDVAAALPARLLLAALARPAAACRIADLCAAPGGKTAQLAAAGADVTALDRGPRLGRLRSNLARLGFAATVVDADAAAWVPPAPFDAELVDAPCTATGAARRHPDIPVGETGAFRARSAADPGPASYRGGAGRRSRRRAGLRRLLPGPARRRGADRRFPSRRTTPSRVRRWRPKNCPGSATRSRPATSARCPATSPMLAAWTASTSPACGGPS